MKKLLLPSLLLLATPLAAQNPVAPYGVPYGPPSFHAPAFGFGSGGQGLAATMDDFETYSIGSGNAENLDIASMDDTSIANGQGPGLVNDGCTYSGSVQLQWNGPAWYGQPSKNILSNSGDSTLRLVYDSPATDISMTLHAFDGFSDSATVTVFDSAGSVVTTVGPIPLPNAAGVPVNITGADMKTMSITGVYGWSPIIDNHKYDSGLSLSISGSCPGLITADVSGASSGGSVAIIYAFATGSQTIPSGFPCAGTVLGLSSIGLTHAATIPADALGNASISRTVPGGACGTVYVQALDITTCTTSNVVGL